VKRMTWMRGAKVLVEDALNVRAGENVVIVGDSTTVEIVEILAYVAAERGAKVVTTFMEPTGRHAAEPPAPVAAAMKAADVILMPTAYSLTHTDARRQATAAGARVMTLPAADESLFTGGSLDIDLRQVADTALRVGRLLEQARHARVTSDNGTDLRLQLVGREAPDQSGLCHTPGSWGGLPCIESAVSPLEGSAEGMWVIDGAIPQIGVVQEPVMVAITGGRVTSIEGGKEAAALRAFLESYRDPSVYWVVEIAVGLNPKARIGRSYLESESEYGTMHLGIGDGTSFGSSQKAPVHCDLVIRNPVFELDGKVILKDRRLFLH